jgi:hypothetical protein
MIWEDLIDNSLHELAKKSLNKNDFLGFLLLADNEFSLPLLDCISQKAKRAGQLEAAFIHAFTATRTDNHKNFEIIKKLLKKVNLVTLQKAGDEIPKMENFQLYRGAASDFKNGFSWTSSIEIARRFASRHVNLDSNIYVANVKHHQIIFYSNDRNEREFVLDASLIQPQKFIL